MTRRTIYRKGKPVLKLVFELPLRIGETPYSYLFVRQHLKRRSDGQHNTGYEKLIKSYINLAAFEACM